MNNYAKLLDGQLLWAPSEMIQDGRRYLPPTEEMFRNEGYKAVVYPDAPPEGAPSDTVPMIEVYTEDDAHIYVNYVPAQVEPDPRTYAQRVEEAIRARYSVSDELAIIRQRDTKAAEFEEYFNFCEVCKAQAKDINTTEQ